jgi:hypothetical protein
MLSHSCSFFTHQDPSNQLLCQNRSWTIAVAKNLKSNNNSYAHRAELCVKLLDTLQTGESEGEWIHYRSYWLAKMGNVDKLTSSIRDLIRVDPEKAMSVARDVELANNNPVYIKQLRQSLDETLRAKARVCNLKVKVGKNRYHFDPYAYGKQLKLETSENNLQASALRI